MNKINMTIIVLISWKPGVLWYYKVLCHHVKHTLFVIKMRNNFNKYCYSYWFFCYKIAYLDIMLYIVMFQNTQGHFLIIKTIINFYHINFNVHFYLIKPPPKKNKNLIRCISHDNQSKLNFTWFCNQTFLFCTPIVNALCYIIFIMLVFYDLILFEKTSSSPCSYCWSYIFCKHIILPTQSPFHCNL
jgi:hypothetical protein